MMIVTPLLLAARLQVAPPGQAPRVSHERLGENVYRLHIMIPTSEHLDAAHALMAQTIRSLCGELHPNLGRWETVAPLAIGNSATRPAAIEIY